VPHATGRKVEKGDDVAFVPLVMPIMFGPGALATILGMTSLVKHSEVEIVSFLAISAATVVTMLLTFLCLAYAKQLLAVPAPRASTLSRVSWASFCPPRHGADLPRGGRGAAGLQALG